MHHYYSHFFGYFYMNSQNLRIFYFDMLFIMIIFAVNNKL